MKNKNVTVLDLGCANLLSVKRALEFNGAIVNITSSSAEIKNSDRLVIPGVGSFEAGMKEIKNKNLFEPLLKFFESKRPLLGICLGMQLLASESHEFGMHKGLNYIPGKVIKINAKSVSNNALKIPHIGWAEINFQFQNIEAQSILNKVNNTSNFFYMVHSFYFNPDNKKHVAAHCSYGGHKITAAINHENVMGFQFHPEKSGIQGLGLLDMFLKI